MPVGATPAQAREVVAFRDNTVSAGTVVVRTGERRLYYVIGDGRAIRYPVGVGWPASSGPAPRASTANTSSRPGRRRAEVKRDKPSLPDVIPGGSPRNPMGAAALTLAGGEYAIHGTNVPSSVGGFVSYGCIRMFNQDVVDLYSRVSVGTTVMVVR